MENLSVDEWFAQVASLQVVGEQRLPILTKLALALATFYNSSSEAERDFHKQNLIHSDKKRHAIVMSHASQLSKDCERCVAANEQRKQKIQQGEDSKRVQVSHCHCSFLRPNAELLAKLRNAVPSQKYKESMKAKKIEEVARKDTEDVNRQFDKKDGDTDLQREIRLLKRRIQEKALNDIKNAKNAKLDNTTTNIIATGEVVGGKKDNAREVVREEVAGVSKSTKTIGAVKGKVASGAGSGAKFGIKKSPSPSACVKGKTGQGSGKKRTAVVPSKKAQKRGAQVDRLLWLVENK